MTQKQAELRTVHVTAPQNRLLDVIRALSLELRDTAQCVRQLSNGIRIGVRCAPCRLVPHSMPSHQIRIAIDMYQPHWRARP
ncbi:hypothetical protein [Paraburkholderia youngii]|uniref:hypothetical protein n=1 Tax=Paraburkholderia youngii TaxID=2782701 RepID=UPI003D257DCB